MGTSGRELIRLLQQDGWRLDRIRGSHHIMVKDGFRPVPVPVHGNKDLFPPLAAAILKQAGLKGER